MFKSDVRVLCMAESWTMAELAIYRTRKEKNRNYISSLHYVINWELGSLGSVSRHQCSGVAPLARMSNQRPGLGASVPRVPIAPSEGFRILALGALCFIRDLLT